MPPGAWGGRSRGEPPAQVGLFGGLINVRPLLGFLHGVHRAPEPIAQGSETPARPSRWTFTVMTHDQTKVAAGRFVAIIVGPTPLASVPRGRLRPDPMRANLKVPPHVAYGSLFVGNDQPYGLG